RCRGWRRGGGFRRGGLGQRPRNGGRAFCDLCPPRVLGNRRRRELIKAGEEELRRLGHRDAILWVLDDNPRARRFYEIAGWLPDGSARQIRLFGFDIAEVRYAKRL